MRYQVFMGGTTILGAAKSPRRYGNLKFRADRADKYIGDVSRALVRKAACHEQRDRRQASLPYRRRPRNHSPLRVEMDKQVMENLAAEKKSVIQLARDKHAARNGGCAGKPEATASGPSPPPAD